MFDVPLPVIQPDASVDGGFRIPQAKERPYGILRKPNGLEHGAKLRQPWRLPWESVHQLTEALEVLQPWNAR